MALNPKTRTEYFIAGREGELPIGSRDPETRIEFFLAGREDELPAGHQEPESRLEHFIKDYRSGGDITVIPLTVTDNGDYTAPEGKAYSPVAVNVALPQNALLLKDIPSTPTAIANFTDGAEMVMPSLTVGVEAVQDLHGYDSPWVGGAGKNKFYSSSVTVAPVTWINSSSESTTRNGFFYDLPVGTYTLKCWATTVTEYIYGAVITSDASATISTFKLSITSPWRTETITIEEGQKIVIYSGTVSGTFDAVTIKLQIELGNTATSYAPYSNICPISGWDEVNVTVADDVDNPTVSQTYTINLGGTRYGGRLEIVNGVARFVGTKGYIASYDGETLPSDWISDRDVYQEGTTPTVGAQVVYTLSTPIIIPLGNYPISSLVGDNNVFADSGEIIDGEYLGGVS
jgi:hypothetical protein